MAQGVTHGAELDALGQCVRGMGVSHPVRRGSAQLFGQRRMIAGQALRGQTEDRLSLYQ